MRRFTFDSTSKTFTLVDDEDVRQVLELLLRPREEAVSPRQAEAEPEPEPKKTPKAATKTAPKTMNYASARTELKTILGVVNDAGGDLSSKEIAQAIGLEEPRGLGQRKIKYEEILRKLGFEWNQVIVRRKTPGGNMWKAARRFDEALRAFDIQPSQAAKEDHSAAEQNGTGENPDRAYLFAPVPAGDRGEGA